VVRARPPLDRARLVARERLRGGRAVPLPVVARHGPGTLARRRGPRARVQRAGDTRRPLAPERGRVLGRGAALVRAARRGTSPTPSSTRSAPRAASSA
jgi:hypothetical protein